MAEDEHVVVPVDQTDLDSIRETGIAYSESEIAAAALTDPEAEWFKNVYQGDKVPQLTLRAVLMGGILGALMSISNLYTSIKLGWAFGVAITACVLSYVIWNAIRIAFPRLSAMTILENNCMQSTASAAGYSTGATIGTAFGALLLITGEHQPWPIMLAWTIVTAGLGVFLAVPMKRQMINREQLRFPSGTAAAQTLKSLYSKSQEAIRQAHSLVITLFVGMFVGFLVDGDYQWQIKLGLKIPELIPFRATIKGVDCSKMPGFGFEPGVLMIAAGMIVGLRVSASMLFGSLILYLFVGPEIINMGQIPSPDKLIKGWALWSGTALMVTSGLTAFALQWKTILRSFGSIKLGSKDDQPMDSRMAEAEVPNSWLIIGLIPLVIAMVGLQYVAFHINFGLGLLSVVMSFFLSLVACRATGETDITPIGAMGKLTQLTYGLLAPSNITTNLMAGSVTANIASSSADLLNDLKSGYLLGANARKQFIAQFIGLFFGSLAIVPAWYLMIPDQATLEHYNPPSANMWKAVAEAVAHGFDSIPTLAQKGLLIGGVLGILLALLEHFAPKRLKPYLPSAMGLGLSWVMPLTNCLSFFVGAVIAWTWEKINAKNAETFVVPVASGGLAGQSLMAAILAMARAATALHK